MRSLKALFVQFFFRKSQYFPFITLIFVFSVIFYLNRYTVKFKPLAANEPNAFEFDGNVWRESNEHNIDVEPITLKIPALKPERNLTNKEKIIVDWSAEGIFVKFWSEQEHYCRNPKCTFTKNRQIVPNADAVLFNLPTFNSTDIPSLRFWDQFYIFFSHESPLFAENTLLDEEGSSTAAKFFNLSMTFRSDSDIPFPINCFMRNLENVDMNVIENAVKGRTKLAAAILDEPCMSASGREDILARIQNKMKVDIFGSCYAANSSCYGNSTCYEPLLKDYKLLFLLESSVCRDFVEKNFFKIDTNFIVPVILRELNFQDLAPADSFVALDHFKSMKSFSKYVNKLQNNSRHYMSYFQWRRNTKVGNGACFRDAGLCQLCQRLHDGTLPKKAYDDPLEWFFNEDQCDLHYVDYLPDSEEEEL